MNWLYNNAVLPLLKGALRLLSFWNPKIRRGLEGREGLQKEIEAHYKRIDKTRKRIWIHVASFGELEQAKPVIEALRSEDESAHIHLTFFSPSGYDNAKGKYRTPDLITYSPFDDDTSIGEFLAAVRPELVLFAKYDVWPNAITQITQLRIPSILFSATLGPDSGRFFPVVRDFNKRVYAQLTKILVIRENDKQSFMQYGIEPSRIEVAGDTRFDQVTSRAARTTSFSEPLSNLRSRWRSQGRKVVVLGSAWTHDVKIFAEAINAIHDVAWIIVPHEPTEAHLTEIESLVGQSSRLSRSTDSTVIIVDSIGKLFEIYSLADIAYVGGGFGAGAHNTLEAAVWGKPVLVGPRHQKTKEVQELIEAGGAFEITHAAEAQRRLADLLADTPSRETAGAAARSFVGSHTGATERIMNEVRNNL